jgi:hypothetical protein
MTILLSALPVRISYKHIVRSFPILASTLVSDWLNLTFVTVSNEFENCKLESALDLVVSQIWTVFDAVAKMLSVRWWSMPLRDRIC